MKRGKDFLVRDKRALSSVVTVLIIIVLSLVAIGVVWVVISGILKQGTNQTGLEQFAINLDINNAYVQTGNITVNVQRDVGEGEMVKIKFILSDGQNSESITQNCTLKPLDIQNFFIYPTNLVPTEVVSVSVAPIFKSANGVETIGDITDTYNLVSGGISGDQNNLNNNNSENQNPLCIPNCGGLQCGLDSFCGQSCGTCTGTDRCTNGICVPLNCTPQLDNITCGLQVCGTKINNCGIIINCLPGCSNGTMCQDNVCVSIVPINNGTVEETWPGTSGMYFGSLSLPIDKDYSGRYVKFFNSSETRCLLIAVYRFPVDGYNKSHVGFNFETSVASGNIYKIFETSNECQST